MGTEAPPLSLKSGDLDRRTWQFESGTFRLIGLDIVIRSEDAALGDVLGELLATFRVEGRAGEVYSILDAGPAAPCRFPVYRGTELALAPPGRANAVRLLLWHLNQRAMFESRGRLVLHAGAVARDGAAIVIPGASGAGKSTLVAGLVLAGFDYLSDEAAVIDPDRGVVDPYPRPISLLPGSWPLMGSLPPPPPPGLDGLYDSEWLVPPAAIRSRVVGGAAPIGLVLIPEQRPGTTTRYEPVSRAEGVVMLHRALCSPADHGARAFECLVALLSSASCVRVTLRGLSGVQEVADELASGSWLP